MFARKHRSLLACHGGIIYPVILAEGDIFHGLFQFLDCEGSAEFLEFGYDFFDKQNTQFFWYGFSESWGIDGSKQIKIDIVSRPVEYDILTKKQFIQVFYGISITRTMIPDYIVSALL